MRADAIQKWYIKRTLDNYKGINEYMNLVIGVRSDFSSSDSVINYPRIRLSSYFVMDSLKGYVCRNDLNDINALKEQGYVEIDTDYFRKYISETVPIDKAPETLINNTYSIY